VKFTFYWLNLRFFASHYLDHNAFMHHAIHILEACDFSYSPA